MALWSLTQERVEKLIRQIGEKETEIDNLIKLSKEDIWRQDLDDFISEWRFQLEEEQRRERKIAGMGRRLSSKLMTAPSKGAGRKRKNDDDDDDYAAPKSKKAAASKKAVSKGALMDYLKSSPKPKPVARQDTPDDPMDLEDDSEPEIIPKKSRAVSKPKAALKEEEETDDDKDSDLEILPQKSRDLPAPASTRQEEIIDDEDDGFLAEAIKEKASRAAKPAAKPTAKATAAKDTKSRQTTKKPAKYTMPSDSESEFGDDLLDDVSKMVKGIGDTNGKAMISEFAQPGTSSALKKLTPRLSKINSEFDPDETDYSKLVPQQSPRRSLLVKQKEKIMNDDDEDDDDEPVQPVARAKAAAKAKPSAGTTAPKSRGRPKKEIAATALAAKKPTAAAKGRGKKKVVESDDDIDAMANDILDSDGDADVIDQPIKARPSRRAAATKAKKYVIDDDSEADDLVNDDSEGSFDDIE